MKPPGVIPSSQRSGRENLPELPKVVGHQRQGKAAGVGGKELITAFRIAVGLQVKVLEALILLEHGAENPGQIELAHGRRAQEGEDRLGRRLLGRAEGHVDEDVHHLVDGIVLVENSFFQFPADGFKLLELIFFGSGTWQGFSPMRVCRQFPPSGRLRR